MKITRLKGSECPTCGEFQDAAAEANGGDKVPKPGDVGVCFNCGAINQYDKNLKLQSMSEAECSRPDMKLALMAQAQVRREINKLVN